MLPSPPNINPRRHFKHPLIATAIGVVIGLIVIICGSYAIYSSRKHVSDCKRPQIYPLYYMNGTFDKGTMVSMCRTSDTLILQWAIQDSFVINNHVDCHGPIYRGDSVGLMLQSPLYRYVNNYYTFIISPKQLVYSQDISPYYQTHSHIFDCQDIKATVIKKQGGWQAKLQIPIQKIGKGYIMATQIINFFRVDIDENNKKTVSISDKTNVQKIKNYIGDENNVQIVKQNLKIN